MADIGTATECPKCGLAAGSGLHRFCKHAECPVREWEKRRDANAGLNTNSADVSEPPTHRGNHPQP